MNLPIINVFWFRRDLRLDDNAGLYHSLKSGNPVLPIFIFDKNILDDLEDKKDRRVEFIYNSLEQIQDELNEINSSLEVYYNSPEHVFTALIRKYKIEKVFTNHDYEPYATERDSDILKLLKKSEIEFHTYKDQVIFEKDEVLKDDGKPYTIFTPYSKKWKSILNDFYLKSLSDKKIFQQFL